jgi:choline kinase
MTQVTKCVIVAAGMSTRMRPFTADSPKCLLEVGGKTILERTIVNLFDAGIKRIGIVVGFEAEKIRTHLGSRFPGHRFKYIRNPHYASTNNAYSLLLGRQYFLEAVLGSDTRNTLLVLDSDILFDGRLLKELKLDGEGGNIAVRVVGAHDEEEIRVKIDRSHLVKEIGKHIALNDTYGESIGIEWFSHEAGKMLFDVLEKRVKQGPGRSEFYEAAFQVMIDRGISLKAVDVSNYPAIEIDTPPDLERARKLVLQHGER